MYWRQKNKMEKLHNADVVLYRRHCDVCKFPWRTPFLLFGPYTSTSPLSTIKNPPPSPPPYSWF